MKIGRYKIFLGRCVWFQTLTPTKVRRWLGFIWIVKEAMPGDINKIPQYKLNTLMVRDGIRYRYWRQA